MATDLMECSSIFSSMTGREAAEAVHNEFPSKWGAAMCETLLTQGYGIDASICPPSGTISFRQQALMLARLMGWAPHAVTPTSFSLKWAVGKCRPQERAAMIASHSEDQTEVKDFTREGCPAMTTYADGCPNHPSWPAMHGSAACASFVLRTVMDLPEEVAYDMVLADWGVANFRALAGVHHFTDNEHGLFVGQACMYELRPEYLEFVAGADPCKVREKMERCFVDWGTMQDRWRARLDKMIDDELR